MTLQNENIKIKVNKPWGLFEQLTHNETTTVKLITIYPGKRTSLQFHKHRSEKWYVMSGKGYALLPHKKEINSGDELFVSQNTIHRLEAISEMKILEISFGIFDELDITRLDDDYAR